MRKIMLVLFLSIIAICMPQSRNAIGESVILLQTEYSKPNEVDLSQFEIFSEDKNRFIQVLEFTEEWQHSALTSNIEVSQDGGLVAIAPGGYIKLLDSGTGEVLADTPFTNAEFPNAFGVTDIAFSPTDDILAAVGEHDAVRLFSTDNLRLVDELENGAFFHGFNEYPHVAFSSDGSLIAVGSINRFFLFDTDSGSDLGMFPIIDNFRDISFSIDDSYLYAIHQSYISLWEVDGEFIGNLDPDFIKRPNEIKEFALNPSDFSAAIVDSEGIIFIWDLASGSVITLPSTSPFNAISFSPDGAFLAAGDDEGIIRLWSINSYEEVANIEIGQPIFKLVFTSDSSGLVSSSADGTVRMWHIILP